MKIIENDCVSCDLPCMGRSCPYRNAEHYYCDNCGSEEKLYHYNDEELCEKCLLENFEVVDGSE